MIGLFHGDCLEVMKGIPDNSVDMCLTDPPYGTTKCKWDTIIPFELMWKELKRIVKDNGAICLFGSEPFSSLLRLSNIKMYKYDWVWLKTLGTNFMNAKKMPITKHEIVSIFYKRLPTYNPQKTIGKPYKDNRKEKLRFVNEAHGSVAPRMEYDNKGERMPVSYINFSNPNNKKLHPTQKPILLLEYLIKTYTIENETVLDFTAGSFSTGVACVNLNRKFIGIEKDKNYFDIGVNRMEDQ